MKKMIEGYLPFLALAALTFLVFWPCLSAGFLSWDDPVHLTKNPFLPLRGFGDIAALFLHPDTANRTYVPLTVLSFGIERALWGLDPFVFHFNNIVLHTVAAWLVFTLARRLGISVTAAFLAALLFAVHPMRVESVAWITERKDVLFGAFYLGAMVLYLDYLRSGKGSFYIAALGCAAASILAKPMAVSLPLVLFLLDRMAGRPWRLAAVVDKVPFMLGLWPVAMITAVMTGGPTAWTLPEVFWITVFASVFYPVHFIWPFGMDMIVLAPRPVAWDHPAYAGALAVLAASVAAAWSLRRDRWVVFAAMFYAATIFFIWQIGKTPGIIVAERFMYIPCVGIVLLLGALMDRHFFRKDSKDQPRAWRVWAVAGVVCALLAAATFTRCWAWQDSAVFWTEALRTNPRDANAHINRAAAFLEDDGLRRRYGLSFAQACVLAERDLRRALELAPRDETAWHNLSAVLVFLGREEEAAAADRRARVLGWHRP